MWFLPLLSFSALSARVQLSPFPRVTHASVVFSRLDEFFFDSCCLFTCFRDTRRNLQFFFVSSFHTHAPHSRSKCSRGKSGISGTSESQPPRLEYLSAKGKRERENCRYYTASAPAFGLNLRAVTTKREISFRRERKGNFR